MKAPSLTVKEVHGAYLRVSAFLIIDRVINSRGCVYQLDPFLVPRSEQTILLPGVAMIPHARRMTTTYRPSVHAVY